MVLIVPPISAYIQVVRMPEKPIEHLNSQVRRQDVTFYCSRGEINVQSLNETAQRYTGQNSFLGISLQSLNAYINGAIEELNLTNSFVFNQYVSDWHLPQTQINTISAGWRVILLRSGGSSITS
jgi:hypothetical protein